MQIFGRRNCKDTRKAERFFSERGISYHFVDLAKHTPSPGELANILRAMPSSEKLIDSESPAYEKRGLAYMDYDEAEEILANPLLMRTPVVREAAIVIVGSKEAEWKALSEKIKK